MILCSCNVISDRDVRAATKSCGAKADRVREVFKHCGRAPKCGKCIRAIQDELNASDARRSAQGKRNREPAYA